MHFAIHTFGVSLTVKFSLGETKNDAVAFSF